MFKTQLRLLIGLLLSLSYFYNIAEAELSLQPESYKQPEVYNKELGGYNKQSALQFDDWVIDINQSFKCCGYYKQPDYNDLVIDQKTIQITADKTDLQADTSTFTGNVFIQAGNKLLYCQQAVAIYKQIDNNKKLQQIILNTNVKIMQPGLRVDGAKAKVLFNDLGKLDKIIINDVAYRVYSRHAHGFAKQGILKQRQLILNSGDYTTCAPNNRTWYLATKDLKLDKNNNRGQAWNVKLYWQKLPVLYLPYISFPLNKQRKTGFLLPNFVNSSNNGRGVSLPFYWNLASNYDLLSTVHYMSKRGFKLDNYGRYLTKNSYGNIAFDFLPNQKQQGSFRYKVNFKHNTVLTKNWLINIDYNKVGDDNYLYDFADNPTATTQLLQKVMVNYNSSYLDGFVNVQQYQTLTPNNGPVSEQQFKKLPEINLELHDVEFEDIQLTMLGNYTVFRTDFNTNNRPNKVEANRLVLQPRVGVDLINNPGIFITPGVQVNILSYSDINNNNSSDNNGNFDAKRSKGVIIPSFDVKAGFIFEKKISIRKAYGSVKNKNKIWLQTLEPIVYYLYTPNRNQERLPNFDSGVYSFSYEQIFRNNRYSGYDRVSEANQIGLGLASKFINFTTGEEQAVFKFGRIYYFRESIPRLNEKLDLNSNWSPWVISAKVNLNNNLNVEASLIKSREETRIAAFNLQYKPANNKVINLSYQLDRTHDKNNQGIKQIGASTAWQVADNWRILGRINYDLQWHRYLNLLAGFEYDSCCTAVKLLWSRDWEANVDDLRRYRHKVRLQVTFKGLGELG